MYFSFYMGHLRNISDIYIFFLKGCGVPMAQKWEGTRGHKIIKNTIKNTPPSVTCRQACDDMMKKFGTIFKNEGRLEGVSDAVYRKFCAERQNSYHNKKNDFLH
jgi:hypothetical protein